MDDEILNAILKRALGYSYKEVQEEYGVREDGEVQLIKRKITDKYLPPDSGALKTYLELSQDAGVSDMSDEELQKEKERLLEELQKSKMQKAAKPANKK